MKLLSLIFVYLGSFLLITALFPTKALCDEKHHATKAWRILGILIIGFLLVYGTYGVYLLKSETDLFGLLVSILMFSGGIFVFAVVKLAQVAIKKLSAMADRERYRSMHDDLTALPNQNYFHDKMNAAIARASNIKKTCVVILIDINRFKEINSSLGHFYGDFILQQIATRIKSSIRNSDFLARWGGDKFAVLLPDTNIKNAIAISNTISSNITQPFTIEGNNISIETSHGMAVFPEHGEQTDRLMQAAHIAMYEAQKNHISYSIFDQDHHHSPFKKIILASEFRDAINTDSLLLYYQPQISVINGKVSGVEALMRWEHPEKGIITPDSFTDVIEQTDLSKALASWVLNKALQQQKQWQDAGITINISINLSIKNLHDYEFPAEIKRLLEKWQVNPNLITLEITESGLMVDPGRVTKVVAELKGTGINLSIDDFGTGYSSLAYLRKFPAREIKIDKSFVLDMLNNEDSAVIVKSTIDLAHNIGRLVVAEGVENHGTYVLLKRFGCDFLQGFFFSRALPADEFMTWYQQYNSELADKAKH